MLKHHTQTDKYISSGIYQMKCLDFPLKYIGETGKNSVLDVKNTFLLSETTMTTLDIETTC
jgi:hypothetical protein